MKKVALTTGITGQAGAHRAELLLKKWCEVHYGDLTVNSNTKRDALVKLAFTKSHIIMRGNGVSNGRFSVNNTRNISVVGHRGLVQALRVPWLMVTSMVRYRGVIEFDGANPDNRPRKLIDVFRLFPLGWKAKTGYRVGLKSASGDFQRFGT